ncbi:phytanoyl-CoA dioxygenase family protein [Mesorhizobium sp. ZC-5]|uniref:phytanoyl-CoA dioxygenase family protein n=1 Tax=Mesorhizobium sp. ZC-5 TaxID=2986066 RepID=UPI0021E7D697|nr:phytanoyl-CoA dioxygenase family protein [Mesorhizobium sp. ZC-5]MCV3242523.1 phytanoyl-CoA dioxygenase family protein [Mesorhizobium sp. ZC-5]
MPNTTQPSLSMAEVEQFIEDGFVRLDHAFGTDVARLCLAELWSAMGLSPDRPEEWRQPVVRLGFMTQPPFVEAANTPRLHDAYDALAGKGRWIAPNGLGTFPVRFPSEQDPGDAGWHVDVSFGTDNPDFMQWRANVKSRGRALLMLFLFSDVGPDDAPTRIRVGSHKAIARQLLPYGEQGMTLGELAAGNFGDTESCDEVLATGAQGTVYLCHPFLVHAAQPHRGKEPRFMAQPPLLPRGEFDPALPPSPVQIAIRKACGLEF